MKYKYSPIFKYIVLLLAIFMFIKHTKILTNNNIFLISISILAIVMVFDYTIIDKHPNLLINSDEIEEFDDNIITNEDIQSIIDNYDPSDAINDLDDDDNLDQYPDRAANYQLPTDFKKQSYDLNNDCYRRGDGRGNNQNVQRYYETDVM